MRKDGTVRFRGGFLEVRPELTGREVELRFDPRDDAAHPRAFVEDRFVCDTVPLDRLRNASRRRRHLRGEPAPDVEPSGLDPLALIEAEHYERVRPVGGPRPAPVSPTADDRTEKDDPTDKEDSAKQKKVKAAVKQPADMADILKKYGNLDKSTLTKEVKDGSPIDLKLD